MNAYQLLQLFSITLSVCNIWMLLEDRNKLIFTFPVVTIGVIIGIIYFHKNLEIKKLKFEVWVAHQKLLLCEQKLAFLEKEKNHLQAALITDNRIGDYTISSGGHLGPQRTSKNSQIRNGNSENAETLGSIQGAEQTNVSSIEDNTTIATKISRVQTTSCECSVCGESNTQYPENRPLSFGFDLNKDSSIEHNSTFEAETSREPTTSCVYSVSYESNTQTTQDKPDQSQSDLDLCISTEDNSTLVAEISTEPTSSQYNICDKPNSQCTQDKLELCETSLHESTRNEITFGIQSLTEMIHPDKTTSQEPVTDSSICETIHVTQHQSNLKKSAQLQDLVQEMCSEFLEDLERQIGRDNPDFAIMLENLAKLHQDAGKFSEAEKFLMEALTITERRAGKSSHAFVASLNNLASLYHAQNKYKESEPLFKLALEIRENILGSNHIELAKPLWQYALLCQKLIMLEESERCLKKALKIYESKLGPRNMSVAKLKNDLAFCLTKLKNFDDAEELCKEVISWVHERYPCTWRNNRCIWEIAEDQEHNREKLGKMLFNGFPGWNKSMRAMPILIVSLKNLRSLYIGKNMTEAASILDECCKLLL